MATFSKQILSNSTNGRGILLSNVSNTTLIHTATNNASIIDEVWLYAQNTDTTARKLTIEFGGLTSPNDLIELTVPAEAGLVLVAPGLTLTGNATTPPRITAFAANANLITIHGYVNRIS